MTTIIRYRLLAALALILSPAAYGDRLNVAVASNFAAPMEEIKKVFESRSEHELVIVRGSSGKHYAQIRNGAPFDVFLSADQARPQRLLEEGIAIQGTLGTYALGRLALWSRKNGLNLGREYLSNTDNYETLAIANPRLAPYGLAAAEVLEAIGLQSDLNIKMVTGENIAQTYQFVYSGNADIGLVAYSQTLSPAVRGQGSSWLVPSEYHHAIRQDMVLLTESLAAREFAAFMDSDLAREILTDQGYLSSEDR
ncbi:MAG: molybdate ABC transporter substrate-binding protein [Gammaproteobacteria bacterium]|nr:molybdate ABC transporter substrate-binding protein [Gammaproteobacteria bacterium]MDG2337449.1 molybdate ABC transporter substrate-binding protein [Gammaproteobacteria bacterium]